METIRKETVELENYATKNSALTLLETIGSNVDSGFKSLPQLVISSNQDDISCGGRDLLPGVDFNCTFRQEGAVHWGRVSGIAGDVQFFKRDGTSANDEVTLWNIGQLFRGRNIMMGPKTIIQSYGDVVTQHEIAQMSRAELEAYAQGLWLNLTNHDQVFSNTTKYEPVIKARLNGQLKKAKKNFFFPLNLAFPTLRSIDQQAIYVGENQNIKFALTTNPASVIIPGDPATDITTNGPYTYVIKNPVFVYEYSLLDSASNNLIKSTNFVMRPLVTSGYHKGPITTTINADFESSPNERLDKIAFSFHNIANAVTSQFRTKDQAYGPNAYSGVTSLFPELKIKRIMLDASGDRKEVNQEAVNVFRYLKGSQSHKIDIPYEHGSGAEQGSLEDLRTVFVVDLKRLPEDLIGSTNKNGSNFKMTIELDGDASQNQCLTLTAGADGFLGPSNTQLQTNFDFYGTLYKYATVHLKGGKYVA